MKFEKSFINKDMTREQERDIAFELLHREYFWLNDTSCVVRSIERNDYHYFINYEERNSASSCIKSEMVACMKRID